MIPYGRHTIDEDDIAAVVAALRQPFITQGPLIDEFEAAVARTCGCRHAVAFCNGTAALHAACLAAELGPGMQGLVPAISFVASANCLRYVGAEPRFVDVTTDTPLLDVEQLDRYWTPQTKAIIPVHLSGAYVPMDAVTDWARRHECVIIEDACHAFGTAYQHAGTWHRVGDCAHSDMTVFSFHPVKSIATGEGGIVTTNSPVYRERLLAARNHGIHRPATTEGRPSWYYEVRSLGFNFRLTDLQAALGLSQLNKLDRFLAARAAQFERYTAAFRDLHGIRLLTPPATQRSAHHLAIVWVDDATQRDALFAHCRAHEIAPQLHYIPIYRHPLYSAEPDHVPAHFPNAEAYFAHAMSIPLYPGLTAAEQDHVITTIRRFFTS